MTKSFCVGMVTLSLAGAGLVGCQQSPPKTEAARDNLSDEVQTTLKEMARTDEGLNEFLGHAYAYAVFPSVGKGGVGVGGAYGRGEVFQDGHMIGYAELTQATVGLQLGGQTYAEVIAFKDQDSLGRFQNGKFAFSANASAIALKSGASKVARYEEGVAVFTMPKGGLMFEATIGGQKFAYQPANQ